MKYFIMLLLGILLACCGAKQYVPVESVKVEFRDKIVQIRDSIYQRDSVYIRERGDTVFVDKFVYLYRDKYKRDTLYHERIDTVAVPYELVKWKEVKKPPNIIEKLLMLIGATTLGILIFKGYKFLKK